jgi:AcrR family transcriptional regulator
VKSASVPPTAPHGEPGATPAPRASRHEGEVARARLLRSGLRLFAQQGFTKTSTRELAEDAGVNVASISYYFGDKAGLYRAVFADPPGLPRTDPTAVAAAGPGLAQALERFFAAFLEPLAQGDAARLCMKLHYREMLEPTGMCGDGVALAIEPLHVALLQRLCAHLGLQQPDDDAQRLALCIAALGVHLHVGHEAIERIAPQLNAGAAALQLWRERLVEFALAMVDAEVRRRGGGGGP